MSRGFLKYVCLSELDNYAMFRCHNSDEYYKVFLVNWESYRNYRATHWCSDDPHFYQVCGTAMADKVTNGNILCGHYLCETDSGRIMKTSDSIRKGLHCNDKYDCINTKADEEECSVNGDDDMSLVTKMKSGIKIASMDICDGDCDTHECEDEASCRGYNYGLYCKGLIGGDFYYTPPYQICNGEQDCENSEDEINCTVTDETQFSCEIYSTNKLVPIHNNTMCHEIRAKGKFASLYSYCKGIYLSQTNCTDPSKVATNCLINGFMSNLSKAMVCQGLKGCDDDIQNQCFNTSATCPVHKHATCDGINDCNDESDETNMICNTKTRQKCRRRIGKDEDLPIPLAWLKDGVVDCLDGEDEKDTWPTCGTAKSLRFVTNNKNCQNVYICKSGEPGYAELANLCDGLETCGNENKVCATARGSQTITTEVLTTNKGLSKHLAYCLEGLKNTDNFNGSCKIYPSFIFPDDDYFGVDTKTSIILPKATHTCDHMFGELYVYTTCLDKCPNSPCPLKNIPRYEVCPDQFRDRIGTIANNKYLAFFTRSFGNIYTNRYFVCDNKLKCLDYSKVCNLVDDCGDDSDEEGCTNHFKCNNSGDYIPKTNKCDGSYDCMDLSDECNDQCSIEILQGYLLKCLSWAIGIAAVVANCIIIAKNVGALRKCQSIVALVNKSLVMMISFGDLLVGGYLFVISIYDGIIYKKSYCTEQINWMTSINCSVIGVLSTIGSQVSLFAMCALSLSRIYGIYNSMRIPGEVTLMKALQVAASLFLMMLASVSIAVVPIVSRFENFFVNGVKYADELKAFIGTPNKGILLSVFKEYFGRTKDKSLSWEMINKMMREMYSHDFDYPDYTKEIKKVDFYGNDGVCLFKYFVKADDPQRAMVWGILGLNLLCFILITASYILIGFISFKSSKSLTKSKGNKQIAQRNRKMNMRISIIITTDFLCWVPFIVICVLHSLEVLDATPWYSLFSIVILPINSVINPLIYDDTVTTFFVFPIQQLASRLTRSIARQGIRRRTRDREAVNGEKCANGKSVALTITCSGIEDSVNPVKSSARDLANTIQVEEAGVGSSIQESDAQIGGSPLKDERKREDQLKDEEKEMLEHERKEELKLESKKELGDKMKEEIEYERKEDSEDEKKEVLEDEGKEDHEHERKEELEHERKE